MSLTTKASCTKEDYPFTKLSSSASNSVDGGWMRRATRQVDVGTAAAVAALVYQAIVWKDRKIVAFLMNKFVHAANADVYCERRRKCQKTPTRIPTHERIRAYQKNYNAIDVVDMKMAAWSVERPSKRWCFRLFHYGLNVVVLNVSIIAAF